MPRPLKLDFCNTTGPITPEQAPFRAGLPKALFYRAITTSFHASLAYKDEESIKATLTPMGLEGFTWIEDVEADTQGYIATIRIPDGDPHIIVAFRGTPGAKDLGTDLSGWYDDHANAEQSRVHAGMYEAFQAVQEQVKEGVLKHQANAPDASVLYTGHSLGSALSAFAAYEHNHDHYVTGKGRQVDYQDLYGPLGPGDESRHGCRVLIAQYRRCRANYRNLEHAGIGRSEISDFATRKHDYGLRSRSESVRESS